MDRKTTAKVNEVSTRDDSVLAAVLAKVEVLSTDMAEVRMKMTPENKENIQPKSPGRIIYGCQACKAKGQNTSCTHCFVCGVGEHKSYDCPEKKSNLNAKRSPMGTN